MDEMRLARFIRSFSRFRRLQPQVGRVHSLILRISRGRLRRSLLLAGGQPVLALTTTGRRTGKTRRTTVAYLRQGEAYAAAALNLGSDRHPAWCLNLRADPRAWIEVGGERKAVRAREATGQEARQLWRAYIERLPMIRSSRSLANRDVPMFVFDPVVDGAGPRTCG
jgi:deazaflavin-dependent oxidoreductase (nitroreductase family)